MTGLLEPLRIAPVADRALLVEFATQVNAEANAMVIGLDRALAAAAITGVVEIVPAYVNLLVVFDPVETDHVSVEAAVRDRLAVTEPNTLAGNHHVVQVCYDDDFAPDLASVADAASMTPSTVIEAHLTGAYRIAMYGFAPGYAYLDGVDQRIHVPRKRNAVPGVPAGSVIIAGPQCLVTTVEMPTGWSVIGRSPTAILPEQQSTETTPTFPFAPGDHITFERIDRATFDRLSLP